MVVTGSGFAGALLAAASARMGLKTLLLEKSAHPRFAIGESTSPLANLLLEEIATRYGLPDLLPLCSYGTWMNRLPHLMRGLKRGFTFYAHATGEKHSASRTSQLLVAASPADVVADTHWMRADIDSFFVQQAQQAGAEYRDHCTTTSLHRKNGRWHLQGERNGAPWQEEAQLVVDAGGARGLLASRLNLPCGSLQGFPQTVGVYNHFEGVEFCAEMAQMPGLPPYPPDSAAVHHLFEGGWIWMLRFDNGVVSAGASLQERLAVQLGGCADPARLWYNLLQRFPSVGQLFRNAVSLRPFGCLPNMAWQCSLPAGDGFALLPSAAACIDPLFSTGIPLALLGVQRLLALLEAEGPQADLSGYAEAVRQETEWTAAYVAACHAALGRFEFFEPLSRFYFAAASFSEICRRLPNAPRVNRFLAADVPSFARPMQHCLRVLPERMQTQGGAALFDSETAAAIEPLNIAGLACPNKQNWYEVDMRDLVRNAEKLGRTQRQMHEELAAAPWAQIPGCSL